MNRRPFLTITTLAGHRCFLALAAIAMCIGVTHAAERTSTFVADVQRDRVVITHSGQPVAEFVFRDEKIFRPYFANVSAPGGAKATRNHQPIAGVDATDHDTMHPGLWLAFGDLSGADFWRNKGRIEHVRFTELPVVRDGRLTFATVNPAASYRDFLVEIGAQTN